MLAAQACHVWYEIRSPRLANGSCEYTRAGWFCSRALVAVFVQARDQRYRDTCAGGDDFVSAGTESYLEWLDQALKRKYAIKTTVIGEAKHLKKELRVINRILRWHVGKGVTLEADPRHAQILIKEREGEQGRQVITPSVQAQQEEEETEDQKEEDIKRRRSRGALDKTMKNTSDASRGEHLPPSQATKYRSLVARANYLTADRADLMFAVKELARRMSCPTTTDWEMLRRLAKYELFRQPARRDMVPVPRGLQHHHHVRGRRLCQLQAKNTVDVWRMRDGGGDIG